jgi:predicted RNA binding protein YcfA (HicA-like mRNA interferase family)
MKRSPTRRPRTALEFRAAFDAPGFTVENGHGSHVKVYREGRLVAVFCCHSGRDLSPGLRAKLCKVLVRYGLLACALAALLAWWM